MHIELTSEIFSFWTLPAVPHKQIRLPWRWPQGLWKPKKPPFLSIDLRFIGHLSISQWDILWEKIKFFTRGWHLVKLTDGWKTHRVRPVGSIGMLGQCYGSLVSFVSGILTKVSVGESWRGKVRIRTRFPSLYCGNPTLLCSHKPVWMQ